MRFYLKPFLLIALFFCLSCGSKKDYIITFLNLDEETVVSSDSISVSFSVYPNDWIQKGFEIHVLIDNSYFKNLGNNTIFDYSGLADGAHSIFAFVCNHKGISLKNKGFEFRNFYIKNKTTPLIKLDQPLLVVHQPQKEKFIGDDGMRILFDFHVLNVKLGNNYHVHYNLDGLDYYLLKDDPIWIEEARRIGEHELKVSLETLDGKIASENPFNSITKRFLVVER